jgi:AraC-like DNA-binding protein
MNSLIISAKYVEGTGHFSNHFHDCNELIYVTGGKASVTVGNNHYEVNPGTLVLISRFEQHAVEADGEDYCRYTLDIRPDASGYGPALGANLLSVLINRPANFCHALSMPGCTCLMEQILEEANRADLMQENMLDLLLFQLLIRLRRAHPELIPPDDSILQVVLQAQQYLEENYAQRIRLEELARDFHLSASYFSHLFKNVTGHSVMGYLKACRIAAAKRLLAQTQLPVGDVLACCGFADCSNFSRTFKEETGFSPSDFRKQYQKA